MPGKRRPTGRKQRPRPRKRARMSSAPHQPKYTKDPSSWRQYLVKRYRGTHVIKRSGRFGRGKPPPNPERPADFFPEKPGNGLGKLAWVGVVPVAMAVLLYVMAEAGAWLVENDWGNPGSMSHDAYCRSLDIAMTYGIGFETQSARAKCTVTGETAPGSADETSE